MQNFINNPFYIKNHIPIISFFLGTFLLIVFALTRVDSLLYYGLMYIFAAILVNIIYSIYLLIISYQKKISLEETVSRLGITMANIPITFLYIYIVFNVIL